MSGRFISFEGGEGSGKSTQARLLLTTLAERGVDCLLTREPGGTPGAEAIRTLLLDPAVPEWSGEAEALLFAAARADHVHRVIAPAVAAGRWVVCDRFIDSSRAYQGAAGGIGDESVMALHGIGSGGLLPDLTLLLETPDDIALQRTSARDGAVSDKIGGRDAAFHAAVADAFDRLARNEPGRFARIDATGTASEVHARVLAAIDARFG